MVSQGMLEANITNRKAVRARKYPGGYGTEILQELSVDISNCWSLKVRSTHNVLCSVIIKISLLSLQRGIIRMDSHDVDPAPRTAVDYDPGGRLSFSLCVSLSIYIYIVKVWR